VQDAGSIACPFCGQENVLVLESGLRSQRFTTDCEVCCRPFEVRVECEDGEVVSIEASGD